MNYFLGIDNGGTVSKSAIFNQEGTEIAVASRKVETIHLQEEWSERDGLKMWSDTAAAIKEVIEKAGISPNQIKAVACTGHGNGLYLIGKDGKPVRNCINSSDGRAQCYIDKWKKNGIDDLALPLTTQSLWAAQPNALLAWIRDNEPEVFAKATTVFMAKDWIRFCLTGERRAEITDMSGTSLMNVVTGAYDPNVLALFGLSEVIAMLPPLVESAAVAGSVTAEAASATGLLEGTPVAGGMFDIDACALSSGILNATPLSLVAGTWGNNQYIAREPLIDKELFMTSRYAIPGWYLMLEGSPTSAGNLEWLIDAVFERERAEMGVEFYAWISRMVESVDPSTSSLIFLPFVYGCNAGKLKGAFYGFDANSSKSHMLRAVFEGVVFAHLYHIERLSKFRDYPHSIRLTGGAAKSDAWCQLFADAIGVPVEVPSGSELGALGAAIVASVSIGVYADIPDAVLSMTSIAKQYAPSLQRTAVYREKYACYKQLLRNLKS